MLDVTRTSCAIILALVDGARSCGSTRRASPSRALSAREREVLRLVAAGATNDRIVTTLGISVTTVERHITQRLLQDRVGLGGRDSVRVAMGLV